MMLVAWWTPIVAGVGSTPVLLALIAGVRWYAGRRAKIEDDETNLEREQARESTARRRIAAEADRGAFERAFVTKAEEHADCIREVRQLREDRERERREDAETIADLRVELAECRKDHEHNARFQDWVRDNVARLPGAPSPPAPRTRSTPPDGTPRPAAKE